MLRASLVVLALAGWSCAAPSATAPRTVVVMRAPRARVVVARHRPHLARPRVSPPPVTPPPAPVIPQPAPAPPAHDATSLAQTCVDEINRYRATLGLRPLARAADREACADGQIRDDAQSGHWHGRFGACGEGAQNECNASPTPQPDMIKGCLHGMWGEGPGGGHYENMKSATATQVWCGFTTTAKGDVWSVQDFR